MSMLKKQGVDLRKYIARKGLFIRLPLPKHMKPLEPEVLLGRSILDRATLDSVEDESIVDWFDEHNEDFNEICYIAYLDPVKVVEYFEITHQRLLKGEHIKNILSEEIL